MGFKADTSFLEYLTMGAVGVRQVLHELSTAGFAPVELERYSSSNKLWATKIKRLRLPDLLCVRTGTRIEVRAKSMLEIRMSHAPNNAARHWDSGLRDEDLVALVVCPRNPLSVHTYCSPTYFRVSELRKSVDTNQLSRLKSAAEGSEQYLKWPSVVTTRPGKVLEVAPDKLLVELHGDGLPARKQSYGLKGRNAYVKKGMPFLAGQMIAATPSELASFAADLTRSYDPIAELRSPDAGDRYAAAKALQFRSDLRPAAITILEALIQTETDPRVALEAAVTAAAGGSSVARAFVHEKIWDSNDNPLQMEAVFALTELGAHGDVDAWLRELVDVANDRVTFHANEARQAAIWGLGRAGLRAYERLLPFLDDPDDEVALHAVAAFGPDAPVSVIQELTRSLLEGSERRAASSSQALKLIGGDNVVRALASAAASTHERRAWIIFALGSLEPALIRSCIGNQPTLLAELEPLLCGSASQNWLADSDLNSALDLLTKQTIV